MLSNIKYIAIKNTVISSQNFD